MNKKIKKPIKSRKLKKKNNRKNRTVKKNRLKFKKKSTGSVRFWFYKPKIEKTEPNPNRKKPEKTEPKPKKPSQTGLNRFFSKKTGSNRTKPDRFEPVSVFFKKNRFDYFFL